MSKHSRVYSASQLDIGAGAFKRAFATHRNAVTTAVKRTSRTSECDGREKEEMLKEDLERILKTWLILCLVVEVEEQKCWRTKRKEKN